MSSVRCDFCRRKDSARGRALSSCRGRCGWVYHPSCVERIIRFRESGGYCRDCRPKNVSSAVGGGTSSSSSSSGGGPVRLEDLLARLERLETKLDGLFGRDGASKQNVTSSALKNPPAYDAVVGAGGPPQFPPKVWTIIFGKLSATQLANARLVCRRWNQIIGHSPALVDKLVLTFPRGTTLDRNCGPIQTLTKSTITLRHTRANFRELTIVGAATWWPSIGQNLLTLTLVDCKISIKMLLEILKATPALKRLTLSCGEHLFFRTLPEVTFTLQYLEHLTLANIKRVELLDIFKQIAPLLKSFKLPDETRNEEFTVAAIRFIWAVQNTLEELELAGEPAELWDRITEAVGMQLKRVSVAGGSDGSIVQSRLIRLSEAFPTVEGLMTPASRLADKTLATIGSNLCKLRHLDVTLSSDEVSCSSTGSHELSFLKSMPELRTLSLRSPDNTTTTTISFGNLKHPNLQALSLRGFQQATSGDNWFGHFANLRSVSLADCTVESWSDLFVPLTTHAKKLANLSLVGVQVRTAGSEYFPDYLERLVTLRLVSCDLSKDSLIMLFTLCPKLARIQLKGLAGVDDEVTLAICQYTRELQEIRVAGCAGLTDLFLEYLWNYYDELAVVDVVDCENVSSEALKELLGGD